MSWGHATLQQHYQIVQMAEHIRKQTHHHHQADGRNYTSKTFYLQVIGLQCEKHLEGRKQCHHNTFPIIVLSHLEMCTNTNVTDYITEE